MRLEWLGTATLKISHEGTTIVTDPFVSRNPEHRELSFEELRDVDAALVTHGHFDHVSDLPAFMERLGFPAYLPRAIEEDLLKRHAVRGLRSLAYREPVEIGSLRATPFPARHVRFDLPLILATLTRLLVRPTPPRRFSVMASLVSEHRDHPMGECVAWLVETSAQRLLHFGSLALDPNEAYPEGVDVLSLPYQGNSKLHELALDAVMRLKPKSVYLTHFDDAFPPVSSQVRTTPLVELMDARCPYVPVVVPEYRTPFDVPFWFRRNAAVS